MIKVLVVDDSTVLRKLLCRMLEKDPEIEIAGQCEDGNKALQFISSNQVDVVTMDIQMPVMDGFETTKRIMRDSPVPVVVVSSCFEPDDVEKTFKAIEAGAVAVLPKPSHQLGEYDNYGEQLCKVIKDASSASLKAPFVPSKEAQTIEIPECSPFDIVAVGASTGGPHALSRMLSSMPRDFPVPVLIVQHIATGFLEGMAQWLSQRSHMAVKVAAKGEIAQAGTVYLAPEQHHMEVSSERKILLNKLPPVHNVRPSVSMLFRSLESSFGARSSGVLLSGMGTDGAVELKELRDLGAMTFAQDRESSVVWGMPGEAVRLSAADQILPPELIGKTLSLCALRG